MIYNCSAVINDIRENKEITAKTERQAWYLFAKEYGYKMRDFKAKPLDVPESEEVSERYQAYEDFKQSPEYKDWEEYKNDEIIKEELTMSKFYGFTNSKKVWTDWNECLVDTKGKTGHSKKFDNWADAAKFSGVTTEDIERALDKVDKKKDEVKEAVKWREEMKAKGCNPIPQVFVDGSYYNGGYAWAFVVIHEGKVIHQANGVGTNKEAAAMNNVAGELAATMRAAKWAEANNTKIVVYHDYQGISSWVDGSWKCRNEFTQAYKEFMSDYKGMVAFCKVAGHTGVYGNELADKLAKKALGL